MWGAACCQLWSSQTRVGASYGQMSRRPPHTVTAPSCSPSVGWACGGLVRAEGSDVMCAACLPPWVSPGRRLQTSAAWGKPPRVYVKQVVSP